jgi:hypothetical protein
VDRHLFPGAVESAVLVVTVLARQRGVGDHVVGQVPLTEVGGRIACLLKNPWQQGSLWTQPVGHVAFGVAGDPGEVAVDVVSGGEMSGHDGGAAGGADAAGDGEAREVGSIGGEAVDIGGKNVGMAVAGEVAPAPIVGEDEEYIGAGSPRGRLRLRRGRYYREVIEYEEGEEEEKEESFHGSTVLEGWFYFSL